MVTEVSTAGRRDEETSKCTHISDEKGLCDVLRSALPAQDLQAKLLAALQLLDEVFQRAGVTYWVTGGTLLGAVRHGGFIPHDDDVAIEIFASDLPRAVEALGSVGRSYRGLGEWPGSGVSVGRFFFWKGTDCSFTISVDIFLREDAVNELREFPSWHEVFPLQRLPFHNIFVSVPHSPEPFLARCYSPACLEDVVVWSHLSTKDGRKCFRTHVSSYNEALVVIGYTAPIACETASDSLATFGLDCQGELRAHLWEHLGWASPLPLDWADESALAMLELEVRLLPVSADLLPMLQSHGLDNLQGITGAFLSLESSSSGCSEAASAVAQLRAVGAAEELQSVEEALAELMRLPHCGAHPEESAELSQMVAAT